MTIFGFKIISKTEYDELTASHVKFHKVLTCRRWFSGWKDLDIIWDYILQDMNIGGVERARKHYAIARGTNEYGTPFYGKEQPAPKAQK